MTRESTPDAIIEAEAQSLLSLAAVFLAKPGTFSQAVGADLAVQAAARQGEAMRAERARG